MPEIINGALSQAQRRRGQGAALVANSGTLVVNATVTGAFMMLFANDVLGFSAGQVAVVAAVTPLISLLRLPFIKLTRRLGFVRTLQVDALLRMVLVLVLICLPASWLTLPVYLGLLLLFSASFRLGKGAVWQPLLRDLTTSRDRGSFFARNRFVFHLAGAVFITAVGALVGSELSIGEYRSMLAIVLVLLLINLIWSSRIPERRDSDDELSNGDDSRVGLLEVLRNSRLLRRPLVVSMLLLACQAPLFVIYLRQVLHVPTNVVSIFLLVQSVGQTLSFVLWGRIADAIGYRPMLIGLLLVSLFTMPLLLLIGPWQGGAGAAVSDSQVSLSMAALLLWGLLHGAFVAGRGIASTTLEHYQVERRYAPEALAIVAAAGVLVSSLMIAVVGLLLDHVVVPSGTVSFADGLLHLDWMKGFLFIVMPGIEIVLIVMVLGLPNARPYFGVADFFNSLLLHPIGSLARGRGVYHDDDDRRAELALWMGRHRNPMLIDPLLALLDDPSYDVRVEAVRSLGRSGSALAGDVLLQRLHDNGHRQLWDQLAWALGELQHEPAYERLLELAQGDYPNRIRAMAVRALGKLGREDAADAIAAILAAGSASKHLLSSCCRALLLLEAHHHAELVFTSLLDFEERVERYELAAILCTWLGIPSAWLLRGDSKHMIYQTLLDEVDAHAPHWQAQRHAAIAVLRARDLPALRELAARAHAIAGSGRPGVLDSAVAATAALERWNLPATLLCAWLLLAMPSRDVDALGRSSTPTAPN